MDLNIFFSSIRNGKLSDVRDQLTKSPFLANIRNPDKDAWDESTPLHTAAKAGHLDMIKLLVDNDADVYTSPMASYPPVVIAAWNEQQEIVDYFLNEIPDKASGTNGLGITITLAARQGWTHLVRKHITYDPLAVHQRGWIGNTSMHWPSHNGHIEIIEMLLDAGADIEADEINWVGGKPLHWASEHEPESVKVLLSRGANVDSLNLKEGSDYFGYTPLMMNASQKNDCAESTELLLEAGADAGKRNPAGRTALEIAEGKKLSRIPAVLKSASSS